ncbi:ATP-grasp domain-containing protein [Azospirillum sp.]|uniref:ATP-grasp domain-containing protein n=1 Tax=Azospirillum sp. TaxID=34012 RepID=UPI003D74D7E2
MPNALLVCSSLYRHSSARLPYALKQAGFGVWIVCPHVALMRFSDYIDGGRTYKETVGIDILVDMICDIYRECTPDIIVPCDEATVGALPLLRGHGNPRFAKARALLDAWYGGIDPAAWMRSTSVEAVRDLGLRTPGQVDIGPSASTAAEIAALGSPVVVKRDNSCGGSGIAVVSTPEDAIDAVSRMGADRPEAFGAGWIVAQEFIRGRSASVTFSAVQGKVLEAFAYVAVHQHPELCGPATVIDVVDCPALLDHASRIVAGLKYSGFGGVDFILPDDGGPPVFLELNGRPTQTTHLGSLVGADLCRAMACAITGEPYSRASNTAKIGTVALFPSEWIRDKNSRHLVQSYHDVPWHERRIAATTIGITPQLLSG